MDLVFRLLKHVLPTWMFPHETNCSCLCNEAALEVKFVICVWSDASAEANGSRHLRENVKCFFGSLKSKKYTSPAATPKNWNHSFDLRTHSDAAFCSPSHATTTREVSKLTPLFMLQMPEAIKHDTVREA